MPKPQYSPEVVEVLQMMRTGDRGITRRDSSYVVINLNTGDVVGTVARKVLAEMARLGLVEYNRTDGERLSPERN